MKLTSAEEKAVEELDAQIDAAAARRNASMCRKPCVKTPVRSGIWLCAEHAMLPEYAGMQLVDTDSHTRPCDYYLDQAATVLWSSLIDRMQRIAYGPPWSELKDGYPEGIQSPVERALFDTLAPFKGTERSLIYYTEDDYDVRSVTGFTKMLAAAAEAAIQGRTTP